MVNILAKYFFEINKSFFPEEYTKFDTLKNEIKSIVGDTEIEIILSNSYYSYDDLQKLLSIQNEKSSIRKDKGVYYTPEDIVSFILGNSLKLLYEDSIKDCNYKNILNNETFPWKDFCFNKTFYDPTCGTGAFLIPVLEKKFDLYLKNTSDISIDDIRNIMLSIGGNDIDPRSIVITKLRVFLLTIKTFNNKYILEVGNTINSMFENFNYLYFDSNKNIERYDVVLGNPPYVEDNKVDFDNYEKYGNIYANVLKNASIQLKSKGVLSMIIPLSYISTIRMKKIRSFLFDDLKIQYILSFSDRPDSLFSSVHQKLNILMGKKTENQKSKLKIFTSNYQYWYKEERDSLFTNLKIIENPFIYDGYIPKFGTEQDISIYRKIKNIETTISDFIQIDGLPLYLNTRAAFWIKVFFKNPNSSAYVNISFENNGIASFIYCLLNSSLFWWNWVAMSDCWHITNKELKDFKVPHIDDYSIFMDLAKRLDEDLERNKVFIGSKQVEYEYKHKYSYDIIKEINKNIYDIYNLTENESTYLDNFALKYRLSQNNIKESNIKILDLFAGCGGLSLGFLQAGYEIVKAVEFNKDIAKSYQLNHPNVDILIDDISNLGEYLFKDDIVDIVLGGPPCQGFSMAGARNRNGFIDDPRNYLFKHYFRIVQYVKPKAFIMENVKGLLSMQEGRVFNEILKIFSEAGYCVNYKIVKALEFGIPQKRERLIIVGSLHNNYDFEEEWNKTIEDIKKKDTKFFEVVNVYDAIGNLTQATESGIISNVKSETYYQNFLHRDVKEIHNHNQTKHNDKAVNRMKKVKNGENFSVLDEEINSIHSGSYGRLSWDEPAPTITTRFDTPSGGRFTHPEYNRTLTPREAARIQSFPDDFVFYGTRTSICTQIGNAVPPKISYFLAKLIERILKK